MSRGKNARKRFNKKHKELTVKGLKEFSTQLPQGLGISDAITHPNLHRTPAKNNEPFSL